MGNQVSDPGSNPLEVISGCSELIPEEIDLSLLEDSLAKTPWERMLANDDALRFADSLQAAMEKRNGG